MAATLYAVPSALVLVNAAQGWAALLVVPGCLLSFTVPVAMRRRHPIVSVGVLLAGLVLAGLLEPSAVVLGLLPLTAVLYTAAVTGARGAFWSLAASLVAALATALPDFRHVGAAAVFVPLYLLASALGYSVGLHDRYTRDLLTYQERLSEAQVAQARQTVTEERMRIARELHDIVAHGMSVITVQAAFANLVTDDQPHGARTALRSIEATGRQTLAELRQLLSVLRDKDIATGRVADPLLPALGLAQLDVLAQHIATAGVQVTLTSHGRRRALPTGVDLSAYRIVQEALTNVVRHGHTDSARLDLDYQDEALVITVTDDGRGCPAPVPPSTGHGLVGMRERAQMYGGEFGARPLPGRGFEVIARLPLAAGRAPSDQPEVETEHA